MLCGLGEPNDYSVRLIFKLTGPICTPTLCSGRIDQLSIREAIKIEIGLREKYPVLVP